MHTARIPPVDPAPATITAVLVMHAGHICPPGRGPGILKGGGYGHLASSFVGCNRKSESSFESGSFTHPQPIQCSGATASLYRCRNECPLGSRAAKLQSGNLFTFLLTVYVVIDPPDVSALWSFKDTPGIAALVVCSSLNHARLFDWGGVWATYRRGWQTACAAAHF
ncbi:hypothetical protein BDD14_4630 [Edaphobacter modestus]|uniref:Uncharacterized protein n=1 Tax=Edaphobacter modestus TaxID=388466 RepID=A0A4Q7YYR0_9BACT|nr:hypothetical protein BDD14_4630 [Edaphobacter modestus]